jgi:hypothetical protein
MGNLQSVRDAGAMGAKWFGALAIGLVVVSITGCTAAPMPVPDDVWLVSPIRYDNAMDGETGNPIDVTYSMQKMTSDTAGGFWTESAGSWLHIDRHGEAVRRFNDELLIRVHAISASSPTLLAVSREEGGQPAGLYLFDTDNGSWTLVAASAAAMGDVVAQSDGRLVFVDYPEGPPPRWPGMAAEPGELPMPYSIFSVDSTGETSTLIGPEAGLMGSAVELDAAPDGTLYVSTESETFVIGGDGIRSQVASHQPSHPILAVSPSGALLYVAPSEIAGADVEWMLDSGSAEAREVMSVKGKCQPGNSPPLTVTMKENAATLPFSCSAGGAVWVSDTSFVVSIGDEGGTVLAKVTLPADWAG